MNGGTIIPRSRGNWIGIRGVRHAVMILLLPVWLPALAVGFVARFVWLFVGVGWDALADFVHWVNWSNDV